jgi:nucleotide-binding universal stress UspA family protein
MDNDRKADSVVLSIHKILVPVAFADAGKGDHRRLLHQAAWLARRFHAEIIVLHVVPPLSYPAGSFEGGHEITARDLHAHVIQRAQEDLERALLPEFDGIMVTRLLLRGDPAREIDETARNRNVDLIVMPTHGYGAFYRLLLGSVTAKVLHETQCPVWTGAHLEEAPPAEFSVRRVLCAVELNLHNRHTVSRAAAMATAVDASLTLVHITDSVEVYGPGGPRVDPIWKEKIVGFASEEIATLQQELGTNAEVIIDSGNVPELLNRAARETKADVLVIGHIPGRSHLGDNGNGYGIIRQSAIPVLSL